MIVKVAGEPTESLISINTVSDTDMEVLEPLLMDIREHQGYYPKGKYQRPGNPTARDLYRKHEAWDIFESILPKPPSGFPAVISVELYSQVPLKMEML